MNDDRLAHEALFVTSHGVTIQCHCEERSDVAILIDSNFGVVRFFATLLSDTVCAYEIPHDQ